VVDGAVVFAEAYELGLEGIGIVSRRKGDDVAGAQMSCPTTRLEIEAS
jgi:hypothetical protein